MGNKNFRDKKSSIKDIAITDYHPFRSPELKKEYHDKFESEARLKWPRESVSKNIDTSFGKTFVRIIGPENAQPLVLLHGGRANSLIWSENVKALSMNYKIITVDTIGDFGLSTYTRIIKNPNEYTLWLNELFDGLSISTKINIMGHSFGGWIAILYALTNPERINKLILAAPGYVYPFSKKYFLFALLMAILPFHFIKEKFFMWVAEDSLENKKASIKEIVDAEIFKQKCIIPMPMRFMIKLFTDDELRNLKVPVLLLIGESEKAFSPVKVAERFNRLCPTIKSEIISGAGHGLIISKADIINQKIIDFLL